MAFMCERGPEGLTVGVKPEPSAKLQTKTEPPKPATKRKPAGK